MIVCPECGYEDTATGRSQTICKNCGTVIDEGKYLGVRIV